MVTLASPPPALPAARVIGERWGEGKGLCVPLSAPSPRQGSQPCSTSSQGASLEAVLMAETPAQGQAGWWERGPLCACLGMMLPSLLPSLPRIGTDKNTSDEQVITLFQVSPPRPEVPRHRAGANNSE